MINSARIIYKGDTFASLFYLGIGLFMLSTAFLLQYFKVSLGFLYLSFGLAAFSIYCIGKGLIMLYIYQKRHQYYLGISELSQLQKNEEILYTENRIIRKHRGRRMHVYIMVVGSIVAVLSVFAKEKGLIMGSSIPIVLLSGIEFSLGLLTEFRLQEYLRILKKSGNAS
ncbi:MAG: hypothetical protein WAT79_04085 [Saprospiraceae bacterium]